MTTHPTSLELNEPVPTEVDVGACITLKVKASCREGCELRHIPIRIMAADEVLLTSEDQWFALNAPEQVGQHTWRIVFPKHETGEVIHEESRLDIFFTARPHTTSMAVWDVPSPVVVNRPFKVRVGVKCSASCSLAGRLVEVGDQPRARLGETPWPGTSALYVAEVELAAPSTEGMNSWSVRFPATECGLAHEEASATFSFMAARAPDHRVTIKVTDKETATPLEHVDVRVGAYQASTDAEGVARLEVPAGLYGLDTWKLGYETVPTTLDVRKDRMIEIQAVPSREEDPDESRVWM